MNLTRVTITGADDSTDSQELLDLSAEFPFVEWGILVSKKQQGSHRFPSSRWVERFSYRAREAEVQVSTHVCGAWVREMFVGELDWMELPDSIQICQRVQINTHAEPHVSTVGLIASLGQGESVGVYGIEREFIFQWDGVNNHLTYAVQSYGINVSALFDTSGGAGRLPESWPLPTKEMPCGYAGGLSDQNVVAQVEIFESICPKPYWIDMERRVRTDDDSALDMSRVRRVLQLCRPLVSTKGPLAA